VPRQHTFRTAYLLTTILTACIGTSAQNQRPAPMPSSDLGRQNFSRVSASAAELKIVLLKDPGLMVELRRWVAKDATDHGQVISDSDLTNDAIFERLASDSQFRSVATQLVQRYGYLVPKVNPDSELGKERELLITERAKWAAQRQEEELAKARVRDSQNLENTQSCDPRFSEDCNTQQQNPSTTSGQRQDQQQQEQRPPQFGMPPNGNPPDQRDLPIVPRFDQNQLDRAQLMQTGEGFPDLYSSLEATDRSQMGQSSNPFDTNMTGDQSRSARLQQVMSRSEESMG